MFFGQEPLRFLRQSIQLQIWHDESYYDSQKKWNCNSEKLRRLIDIKIDIAEPLFPLRKYRYLFQDYARNVLHFDLYTRRLRKIFWVCLLKK